MKTHPTFSMVLLVVGVASVIMPLNSLASDSGGGADSGSTAPSKLGRSPVVAGQSIEQWTDTLEQSDDRTVRLRAVRSLSQMGFPAATTLRELLSDSDAAVQYLAAAGIGDIAGSGRWDGEDEADAKLETPELVEFQSVSVKALRDCLETNPIAPVQLAIHYALCQTDTAEASLEPLIQAIESGDRAMACAAGDFLGRLGKIAEPVLDRLDAVYQANDPDKKNGDYHIGGAARNAARKIRKESN